MAPDDAVKIGRVKRRIFLAVDLPAELKARVAQAIQQWRWLPIRWLPPENWHITLIPPVYLEEGEVGSLVKLLGRHHPGGPFRIRFSRIALAPPGRPARMVWLEGDAPPALVQLKEKLERLWASAPGLPPLRSEERPAALHATLARFESGALRELEAKTRLLGKVGFSFEARELSVMVSHLKPSGAAYETLAVIPLA